MFSDALLNDAILDISPIYFSGFCRSERQRRYVAQCPSSAHRLLQRRNLAHTFLNFLLFIVGSSLCKVGRYRRRWSDNFSIREQVRE